MSQNTRDRKEASRAHSETLCQQALFQSSSPTSEGSFSTTPLNMKDVKGRRRQMIVGALSWLAVMTMMTSILVWDEQFFRFVDHVKDVIFTNR